MSAARAEAAAPSLAAVLFDLDGLLVDSEPVWTIAERELVTELGGTWSAELKAAIVGTSLEVCVPLLVRAAGREGDPAVPVRATAVRFLARVAELFRAGLRPKPGAVALLDALAARGVPLGLVSNSYRVLVDAALPALGASRFAATVAGDEVPERKPAPAPYLALARRLAVPPASCVAFEDSPTGVAAAEAAGCTCVVVPDQVAVPSRPGRPVLRSLAEVDLDWLATLPLRQEPFAQGTRD